MTLTTTGKAIEFAVSGSVVDGEDGVVNEPMQWVVTVYKNGKEIEKRAFLSGTGRRSVWMILICIIIDVTA